MAKKLGNDYRLWAEDSTTPGTYNIIGGQGSLEYSRSSQPIDTSDKNASPYSTAAPGNFDVRISLDGFADLPDAKGLTLVETKFKARESWKFQIRKGGASGTDTDKVFEGTMNILDLPYSFPQNGAVAYKITLACASAPTTDALA